MKEQGNRRDPSRYPTVNTTLTSTFTIQFDVLIYGYGSVQFSHSVVSDSLQPHEPEHARPPCASTTPGVHPNPWIWFTCCFLFLKYVGVIILLILRYKTTPLSYFPSLN